MSIQESKLKAIADAIREKEGSTEPIPANDFPARILAIPTGGGLPDDVRTITLSADPPDGGTVSGGGVASDGMTLTIDAGPSEGYNFADWEENGQTVSADAEYTFTVDGDRKLVAVFAAAKPSRLPDGYTELEYLETNGGSYFDTGVKPSALLKLTMDVAPLSAGTTYGYLFNSAYSSSSYFYGFRAIYYPDDKNIKGLLYSGSTSGAVAKTIKNNIDAGKRIIVAGDYSTKTMSVDESTVSFTSGAASSSMQAISLLSIAASGTRYYVNAKLYSCQIENGGVLVRNFVPCIDQTGTVGMYDLVEGKFYANTGTGSVTAGPAV